MVERAGGGLAADDFAFATCRRFREEGRWRKRILCMNDPITSRNIYGDRVLL